MRIDPNTRLASTPDSGESAKSAAKTAQPLPGAEALGTDRAELSIDQARAHALAAQVTSLPEVRQEKVATLARALRNGEYEVSSEQTADAMLSEISGHRAARHRSRAARWLTYSMADLFMGDLFNDRLEPAAGISQISVERSQRESDSRERRRPATPPREKIEPVEDSETPPHQLDDMA